MAILESLALKAALGSIKDVIFDGLGWVVDHPWQSAAIGAGAWLGWLLMFTVPGLKSEAEAEKRAHQVTKQNYTTAMAQAEKRFAEAWSNWEERYRDMATETDNAERDARIEMLSFAERHIANNRVRCEVGAGLGSPPSGATGAATGGGGSEGVERSDQVSKLVAVRPDDVRICTENTSRLKAAQEWASGLQQADTQ